MVQPGRHSSPSYRSIIDARFRRHRFRDAGITEISLRADWWKHNLGPGPVVIVFKPSRSMIRCSTLAWQSTFLHIRLSSSSTCQSDKYNSNAIDSSITDRMYQRGEHLGEGVLNICTNNPTDYRDSFPLLDWMSIDGIEVETGIPSEAYLRGIFHSIKLTRRLIRDGNVTVAFFNRTSNSFVVSLRNTRNRFGHRSRN